MLKISKRWELKINPYSVPAGVEMISPNFAKYSIVCGETASRGPAGLCIVSGHVDEDIPGNAHLIAAAPDLYEAAEELMEILRGMPLGPQHNAMVKLHNALAKARGEK